MGQGDLGHAVIRLLNAAHEQETTHLQPTNKWEREVLQGSVAEGNFGLGGWLRRHGGMCPPGLPGGLTAGLPCRKARRFLKCH